MPSAFIFIATNRLKPGRLRLERDRVPKLVEFVAASEPRLIAFNECVNEAGDEVSVVQVHPDAGSMEAHLEIVRERAQEAYAQTLDATVRIQVFGRPTQTIPDTLRQQASSGVEISVNGEHLGGFTRSSASPEAPAAIARQPADRALVREPSWLPPPRIRLGVLLLVLRALLLARREALRASI